jgi:hypothetical protein
MLKEAIRDARALLEEDAPSTAEAVASYQKKAERLITRLRRGGNLAGLHKTSDMGYLDADSLIEQISKRSDILNAVVAELPSEEDAYAAQETAEVDLEGSVDDLALITAHKTMDMDTMSRMTVASMDFDEKIVPLLGGADDTFPRGEYLERVRVLCALSPEVLAAKVAERFTEFEPAAIDLAKGPKSPVDEATLDGKGEHPVEDEASQDFWPGKFDRINNAPSAKNASTVEADHCEDDDEDKKDDDDDKGDDKKPWEKDSTKQADATVEDKPPRPKNFGVEELLEDRFDKNVKVVGPNRRRPGKDVPAHSTPKKLLFAAKNLRAEHPELSAEAAIDIAQKMASMLTQED